MKLFPAVDSMNDEQTGTQLDRVAGSIITPTSLQFLPNSESFLLMSQNQEKLIPGEPVVIVHYGEVGLKGANRGIFEKKLQSNIKRALQDQPIYEVLRLRGRLVIRTGDVSPDTVATRLSKVPGIVYFSPGVVVETEYDPMEEKGLQLARESIFDTFSIRASRSYKEFHLNSQEINEKLGAAVLEGIPDIEVDLDNPSWTLFLEVLQKRTLLYTEKLQGVGGLPVSTAGRVLSLLSGGIDSPVASYMMMKRGCRTGFVHFHSFPLTDRAGQEKAEELAQALTEYQQHSKMYLVPFADCQQEIVAKCPANLRILLYRRFMMRISESIARKEEYEGLVSGENLAQVSSQTLSNLGAIEAVLEISLFRPLLAFDKQEIVKRAKEIGTYETSIQPHQDCCSYLMPDNPATSSTAPELTRAEEDLNVRELVAETLENLEIITLN